MKRYGNGRKRGIKCGDGSDDWMVLLYTSHILFDSSLSTKKWQTELKTCGKSVFLYHS